MYSDNFSMIWIIFREVNCMAYYSWSMKLIYQTEQQRCYFAGLANGDAMKHCHVSFNDQVVIHTLFTCWDNTFPLAIFAASEFVVTNEMIAFCARDRHLVTRCATSCH